MPYARPCVLNELVMATATDNGATVKEGKSSSPVEKTKGSSSGGQSTSKVLGKQQVVINIWSSE